jgi:ubiquinone/menaquinone biosynthesis C-methylase UbiE
MFTLDPNPEPLSIIINKLRHLESIEAADIGCGSARYDMLLYRNFGSKLKLKCLDANDDMLRNLTTYLSRHGVSNLSADNSTPEGMPLADSSMDCILSLGAVHHFDLSRFFSESARVTKSGGYLFLYTRLCELKENNTWGIYFPLFDEKNIRLYSMEGMKQSLDAAGGLALESVAFFTYNRMAAIEQMAIRAGAPDPSLYTKENLIEAFKVFSINFSNVFEDTKFIQHYGQEILLIIRKRP